MEMRVCTREIMHGHFSLVFHFKQSFMDCCCFTAKLCLTLCKPMDCSPPGSSVHGALQARILEWVAISFPRGYSGPRGGTCVFCLAGEFLTTELPGKPLLWILDI